MRPGIGFAQSFCQSTARQSLITLPSRLVMAENAVVNRMRGVLLSEEKRLLAEVDRAHRLEDMTVGSHKAMWEFVKDLQDHWAMAAHAH